MALYEKNSETTIQSNIGLNRWSTADYSGSNETKNGSHFAAGNASRYVISDRNFFSVYFSHVRFSIETLLASLTIISNCIILTAIWVARRRHRLSVYNFLFTNLGVANVLSCSMLWLTNNSLLLFRRHVIRLVLQQDFCRLYVYMTAAIFVSSAFGVVSTVTMLGFVSAQYLAVCRPLQHLGILRRRRLFLATTLTWFLSFLVGIVPFAIVYTVAHDRKCVIWIHRLIKGVVVYWLDACAFLDAFIYAAILLQCVKIYARMRVIRREMSRNMFLRDMRKECRAVRTTFILLATYNLLFVPYLIIHLLSLNVVALQRYLHSEILIYYMNTTPYVKCIADPIVYGLRMREFRVCALKMRLRCVACLNRYQKVCGKRHSTETLETTSGISLRGTNLQKRMHTDLSA